MEGYLPITEEIATETWEDVKSISVERREYKFFASDYGFSMSFR